MRRPPPTMPSHTGWVMMASATGTVPCPRNPDMPDLSDNLPDELQSELRPDLPHSARVWNYWLGGKDNYEADREVGDAAVARDPNILVIAREARRFLVRVVSYLTAEAGVDQFLDI